jgi:hypothetical protein
MVSIVDHTRACRSFYQAAKNPADDVDDAANTCQVAVWLIVSAARRRRRSLVQAGQ